MKKDIIEVVRLVVSQKDQAAKTLARAFQEDPLSVYIFPDADRRRRSLAWQWETVIRYSLAYGKVFATPGVRGVACWLEPWKTKVSIWRMLLSGVKLQQALKHFGGGNRRASLDIMGYLDRIHERLMDGPHWYLWALGVDPASQGRGIGGKLLQPVLKRAARDGFACYLETMVEGNLAFYQKHGFEIASAEEIPGHGLIAWMMVKDPRSG